MHNRGWSANEPPTRYESSFFQRTKAGVIPDLQIHSAFFLWNHCVRLRQHLAAKHEHYSCDTEHDHLWECRRRSNGNGWHHLEESWYLGSRDPRPRRERSGLFDRGRNNFPPESSGRRQCGAQIAIYSDVIWKHDRASDDHKQPCA